MKNIKKITGRELKSWVDFLNVDDIMLYDSDMNNIGWLFEVIEQGIEDQASVLPDIKDNEVYYIEG